MSKKIAVNFRHCRVSLHYAEDTTRCTGLLSEIGIQCKEANSWKIVIPAFEHLQFQGWGENSFRWEVQMRRGKKKCSQKQSQISRRCKLEQCRWSQSSSDNLQKPKCYSRILSEHNHYVLCCLPLSKQKLLTEAENLLPLKQTHFHQLWEDFGQVHVLKLRESSRLFLNQCYLLVN